MLFPTIDFAIYFVVVFTGSWLLRAYAKPWRWFILVASCVFYLNPFDPTHQTVNPLALALLVAFAGATSWLLRRFASGDEPGTGPLAPAIGVLVAVCAGYVVGNVVLASQLNDKSQQAWKFLFLLIGLAMVNQAFARATWACLDRDGRRTVESRWVVRAAVAFDLGVLGYFKYLNWFNDTLKETFAFGLPIPLPDLLLPLAISFFTFQAVSYVLDIGRGQQRPIALLDFTIYLSFFAHLVAGPIVRVGEFAPQLDRPADPRFVQSSEAFMLIFRGLFKKVVISAYLAGIVDPMFAETWRDDWTRMDAIGVIVAYAVQIYADFSGYTDIAIGVALLLGIRFPQNFDAPYAARSFQDFWRRWHMTLSRWLRDYLYIPLGGSRKGEGHTYVNLFLTMLLGGLWHGANITYVIWGAIHGVALGTERWVTRAWHHPGRLMVTGGGVFVSLLFALAGFLLGSGIGGTGFGLLSAVGVLAAWYGFIALEHATDAVRRDRGGLGVPSTVTKPLQWGLTFGVVAVALVFFRAPELEDAFAVLNIAIFGRAPESVLEWVGANWLLVVVLGLMLASQFVPPRIPDQVTVALSKAPPALQAAGLAVAVMLIDAFGPEGIAPFIYFNF